MTINKLLYNAKSKQFYLCAYFLGGAALMGSSIGLVVYQTQQLLFLSNLNNYLSITTFTSAIDNSEASSGNKQLLQATPTPQRFISFAMSIWVPLSLWSISLLATSLFTRYRNIVPRVVSSKTAIISSQVIFSLFWIISGGFQQIEEKISIMAVNDKAESAAGNGNVNQENQQGSIFDDQLGAHPQFTLNQQTLPFILVPLTFVWLISVVLLGVATGLLTTSSSILEAQVQMKYKQSLQKIDIPISEKKYDALASTSSNLSEEEEVESSWKFTTRQNMELCVFIIGLFAHQMHFFHWIIRNGSLAVFTNRDDNSNDNICMVSTALTLFGLVSGIVMVSIGLKFIPSDLEETEANCTV